MTDKRDPKDATCGSCYWRENAECRRMPPAVAEDKARRGFSVPRYPKVPESFPACGEYEHD
jgi:hypothetical protein